MTPRRVPVSNPIKRLELAKELWRSSINIKNLLGVIKDLDKKLEFVDVTGQAKHALERMEVKLKRCEKEHLLGSS